MKDHDRLTKRELEVLRFMSQGLANKQICEKIGVGASTVKTHVINIYNKLGLSWTNEYPVKRVNAVLYYLNNKEELEK